MFLEDQTITYIKKEDKTEFELISDDLIDLSSISLTQPSTHIEGEGLEWIVCWWQVKVMSKLR